LEILLPCWHSEIFVSTWRVWGGIRYRFLVLLVDFFCQRYYLISFGLYNLLINKEVRSLGERVTLPHFLLLGVVLHALIDSEEVLGILNVIVLGGRSWRSP